MTVEELIQAIHEIEDRYMSTIKNRETFLAAIALIMTEVRAIAMEAAKAGETPDYLLWEYGLGYWAELHAFTEGFLLEDTSYHEGAQKYLAGIVNAAPRPATFLEPREGQAPYYNASLRGNYDAREWILLNFEKPRY